MLKYYLHTAAITNTGNLIEDLSKLMGVKYNNMTSNDILYKYSDIWNSNTIQSLYGLSNSNGFAINAILKFITQCESINQCIDNEYDCFSKRGHLPVGFLGIDFANTSISSDYQISDAHSFMVKKRRFLQDPNNVSDNDIDKVLKYLYPNYDFQNDAIKDIVDLKNNQTNLYKQMFPLLDDICNNPFTGGLGKTEVLHNSDGIASKRLTDEHRITYKAKSGHFDILHCKGHYK